MITPTERDARTTHVAPQISAEIPMALPSGEPQVVEPHHRTNSALRPQETPPTTSNPDGLRLIVGDRAKAQKASEASKARRDDGAHFRRGFVMSGYWDELAKERGIRMPQWTTAPTKANVRKWLKTLGISQEQYRKWSGCDFSHFAESNPDFPMRALLGYILDWSRDTWIAAGRPSITNTQDN